MFIPFLHPEAQPRGRMFLYGAGLEQDEATAAQWASAAANSGLQDGCARNSGL